MQGTLPGGYVDFSRFAAMRAQAQTAQGAALEQVADEFEALFVDLMLKTAREAEMEGGLFDSNELDTYREMLDQQMAITIARNHDLGIGLAMSRQIGAASGEDSAKNTGELHFDAARRVPDRRDAPVGMPYAHSPHRRYERAASGDPRAFISELGGDARRAAAALGVSARGLMAQAALETGWGQHVIRHPDGRSSHNYFGVKAGSGWQGEIVRVPTTEYVRGRAVTVDAAFRAYDSPSEAFDDYVGLIEGNPRYEQVRATGGDVARFARELARAGYATDPRYAEKIVAIHDSGVASELWTAPE